MNHNPCVHVCRSPTDELCSTFQIKHLCTYVRPEISTLNVIFTYMSYIILNIMIKMNLGIVLERLTF